MGNRGQQEGKEGEEGANDPYAASLRPASLLSDSELSQNLNRLQEDLTNIESQSETWDGQGKGAN